MGVTYTHPQGTPDNGATRSVCCAGSYIAVYNTNKPGETYTTGLYVVGGEYNSWGYDGSTVTISNGSNYAKMRGGEPGTAGSQAAYYYYGGGGGGSWSGGMGGYVSWEYNAPSAPSGAPSYVRSSDGTTLKVTSQGASGPGIDFYEVRYSTDNSNWSGWSANNTTFGVTSTTNYYVQSRAHGAGGYGAASSSAFSYGVPSTPQSVSATASPTVSGRITVGWSAPSTTNGGITRYHLYRSGTYIGEYSSATTSVNVDSLTPGTSYYFDIYAGNAVGFGTYSRTSTLAAPGVPGAPTGTTATSGTNSTDTGKIYVSWTEPSTTNGGITGYDLYRGTTKITLGNVTTYTDTALTVGTNYTYKVQARNAFADSSGLRSADSTTSTAMAPGVPSAPQTFTSTPDGTTAGKINLAWAAPATTNGTITGYDIYRKLSTDAAYLSTPTTIINGAATLTQSYTGLVEGSTYNFKIVARNAYADSSTLRSAEATASAMAPGLPTAPQSLVATASTSVAGQIALTWAAPSSPKGTITGYDVYRKTSTDASFPATPTTILNGTGVTYTYTGLTIGTTYNFKVQARNAYADSSTLRSADSTTVTALSPGVPTAPTLVSAVPSPDSFGTVTLTWTKPSNTGGGVVSYYMYADGVLKGSVTGEDTLSGVVLGLNVRQSYTFTVAARNAYAVANNTTSPASNAIVAVSPGPPTAPRNLTGNIPSSPAGVANLSWTVPEDTAGTLTGYSIYFSDGTLITDTFTGVTSYTVTGLIPATTYTFYVKARNELSDIVGIDSDESNTFTGTALGEPSAPRNLAIASTPAVSGRLILTWDAPLIGGTVTGYNVFLSNGTKIGSTTSRTFVVDGLSENVSYSYYVKARNSVTDTAGTLGGTSSSIVSGTPGSTSTQALPTAITVSNETNATFNGQTIVASLTSNTLSYAKPGADSPSSAIPTGAGTAVNNTNTIFNGTYSVTGTPEFDKLTYSRVGPNLAAASTPSGTVTDDTNIVFNGTYEVTGVDVESRTVSYFKDATNVSSRAVPTTPAATVSNTTNTVFNADNVSITAITENTISYDKIGVNVEESAATGVVYNNTNREIYNGTFTVTGVPAYNQFAYSTGDDVTKTNLAINPSMERVGTGVDILRTNHYTNPRMSNSTTGWTLLAAGATQTPDINGTVIDFSDEVSPMEAFFYETTPMPIEIGEHAVASLEFTVPTGFDAITLTSTLRSYGAGDAEVQSITIEPGQTFRLTSGVYQTLSTSTGIRNLIGTSSIIPAGARLVVRNAIFEKTDVIGDYFDGASTDELGWDFAWVGTADASKSVAKASAVVIRKNEITNPGLETSATGELLRTNYFTNPGFEAAATGWTSFAGMTNARSTSEFRLGGASMQGTSTTTDSYVSTGSISVSASASYTASAWVKGTAGKLLSISIQELNSGATVVGTTTSSNLTLTGSWQRISASRTLTSAASTVKVYISDKTPANAGVVFYVDDTLLEKTAFLEDYFDGETPDADGRQYAWTGAANASTSTVTSSTVYATNLMTNPSVESVTAGTDVIRTNLLDNPVPVDGLGIDWAVTNPGTGGVYAQEYTVDGFLATVSTQASTTNLTIRTGPATGTTGRTPVTAGLTYTVSATVTSSIADARSIGYQWFNVDGGGLTVESSTRVALPANVPTRLSFTGVAPAGAVSVGLLLVYVGATGPDPQIRTVGSTITVKEALFEQTNQLLPYFDGSSTDANGWTYDWADVANESVSQGKALSVTTRTNLLTNPSMEDTSFGETLATNLVTNPSMEASSGTVTVRTNLVTNPSMEAVSTGAVVMRRNLVTNPSFEADLTGWNSYLATNTRSTSEKYLGTASLQVVYVAGSSAYTNDLATAPGVAHTASAWVKGDVGKTLKLQIIERTASTQVGFSETLVVGTGSWQRVSVTRNFGATGVFARVQIASDVVQTAFIDAVMLEASSTVGDFFDGSTTDALGWDYAWSGTANASISTAASAATTVRDNLATNPAMEMVTAGSVVARQNLLKTPNAKSGYSPWYGSSGAGTTSYLTSSGLPESSTYVRLTITTAGTGSMGAYTSRLNTTVVPGRTYTFSSYGRTSAAGKSSEIRVRWYNDSGTTLSDSASTMAAHAQNTWARRSLTVTAPAGATSAWVALWFTTNNAIGETYDMAATLVEETSILQDYFDGSTTDALGWDYAWSGTVDDSISTAAAASTAVRTNLATNPSFETVTSGTTLARQNYVTNPNFEVNTTSWTGRIGTETLTRDTATFYSGVASLKVVTPGNVGNEGAAFTPVAYLTNLVDGSEFVASAYVKATAGVSIQVVAFSSGSGASSATTTITATGVWQRVTTPAAILGVDKNPYVVVRTAATALATTFYVDNAMIEIGPNTGEYFDGSTTDALGWDYAWSGTAGASISTAKASSAVIYTNLATNPSFETASGTTVVTSEGTKFIPVGVSTSSTARVQAWQDAAAENLGAYGTTVQWVVDYSLTATATTGIYALSTSSPYAISGTLVNGEYVQSSPTTTLTAVAGKDGLYA